MSNRGDNLLELIRRGLKLKLAHSSTLTLGDRSQYIGMSDIGAYLTCPRMAVMNKLYGSFPNSSLSKLLTLNRGHWFEEGIAAVLRELGIPHVQQLEIFIRNGDTPIKAHLDFLLITTHPKPTVRILEIKSSQKTPEVLYPSYEMQVYGQIGLLHRHWNDQSFNYHDEKGVCHFEQRTFPEAARRFWGIEFPDDVSLVDIEAWVLCLSMTDAKVFGPYKADYDILNMSLDSGNKLWKFMTQVEEGVLDISSIDTSHGFNPMCNHCVWNSDCPKFGNHNCPELQTVLEDLARHKEERDRLDNTIRQYEQYFKDWYVNSNIQGGWIEAGNHRFRVAQVMGRRRLDKESLREELSEIFRSESLDSVDVPTLISRHEKVGDPSSRLFVSRIHN